MHAQIETVPSDGQVSRWRSFVSTAGKHDTARTCQLDWRSWHQARRSRTLDQYKIRTSARSIIAAVSTTQPTHPLKLQQRATYVMDKDRIKGTAESIKGSIEKNVGKLVGNKKLETEGKIDEAAGNIRNAVGKGKDVIRDAVKVKSK